jgi:hypothetical protein
MQGQHSGESLRSNGEGSHHALPKRIAALKRHHEPGHQSRASRQLPVLGVVEVKGTLSLDKISSCKINFCDGWRFMLFLQFSLLADLCKFFI